MADSPGKNNLQIIFGILVFTWLGLSSKWDILPQVMSDSVRQAVTHKPSMSK